MYLYNVTVKVDYSIQEQWVLWMKNEHIPEVMSTECFVDYTFAKLLDIDDTEGPTFSCQYKAASKADYNRYIELYSTTLRQAGLDKWGNKCIGFRSLMQVVN